MTSIELANLYRAYIDCLNRQDWPVLTDFVHAQVEHNGRPFGVSGYRRMLEQDFAAIPDLCYQIDLLVADPPYVACRLHFQCTPVGEFLGLDVRGRKVTFAENVFYQFVDGKIVRVWSVIDKAAIEAQLQSPADPDAA